MNAAGEEIFLYGTLAETARRTASAILIPDVVKSRAGWRGAVRTQDGTLVWVDGEDQPASDAWEYALLGIRQLCAERERQASRRRLSGHSQEASEGEHFPVSYPTEWQAR